MSPTQCESRKIISPNTRKNSHGSEKYPEKYQAHAAITVEVSFQSSPLIPDPQPKPWTPACTRWVFVGTKFMGTLEEKQQSQGKNEKLSSNMCCLEKAEALFVTSDVSNHALPIWKPMYFVPSATWEAVPWLSAAQGVHVPFFLHPSGPVGLPAESSVNWSKRLLCYLRIEGRLTKHMGPVEPVRMIKKKKKASLWGMLSKSWLL